MGCAPRELNGSQRCAQTSHIDAGSKNRAIAFLVFGVVSAHDDEVAEIRSSQTQARNGNRWNLNTLIDAAVRSDTQDHPRAVHRDPHTAHLVDGQTVGEPALNLRKYSLARHPAVGFMVGNCDSGNS